MNKQELIKIIDKNFDSTHKELKEKFPGTSPHNTLLGTLNGLSFALNLATQLDEPKEKKPVVPQFVVDWFENNTHNLENGIYQLCVDLNEGDLEGDFKDWFNGNHSIETLIHMQHGYSVEREPKWVIKCPEGYVQSIDISNTYTSGDSAKDYTRTGITPTMDRAIRFTDKDKAQVLATFVGEGEVKEWTEQCGWYGVKKKK